MPLSISVSSSLKWVSGNAWSLFTHTVLLSEDFSLSQSSQWHVVQQCISLKANSQVWQTGLWLSYAFPCATMFTCTFMCLCICHVSEYLCTYTVVEVSTLAYIHTFFVVCVFIYNTHIYIYNMCIYINICLCVWETDAL